MCFLSAAFGTYQSHQESISTSGLFKRGSLGIWKPLGVLGVKNFTAENKPLTDDQIREDYDELYEYLTSQLRKRHGQNVLKQILPDTRNWLESMKAPIIDEESIAFDPSLLPRRERGVLGLDVATLLRKEMPLLGSEYHGSTSKILIDIPAENELEHWREKARKNIFLEHWSTHKLRMMENERMKKQDSVSNSNSSATSFQHTKTKQMSLSAGRISKNSSNPDKSATLSNNMTCKHRK